MGGLIGVLICAVAAYLFHAGAQTVGFWTAVAVGLVVFWSWGVMHNYAMDSAKARLDQLRENMILEGRPPDDIERLDSVIVRPSRADKQVVPDWITRVNMVAYLAGVVLLAVAVLS